jgi:hypothetical protein
MSKIEDKDEIVQRLISIVQKQKEAIEKASKPVWETNCVFVIDGKTSNIRTISTVDKVVELYSHVVSSFKVFTEACGLLNVKCDFRFNGFTFEQWTNDFTNVVNILNINVMKTDLAKDEAILDKLVSKEKREELELLTLLSK